MLGYPPPFISMPESGRPGSHSINTRNPGSFLHRIRQLVLGWLRYPRRTLQNRCSHDLQGRGPLDWRPVPVLELAGFSLWGVLHFGQPYLWRLYPWIQASPASIRPLSRTLGHEIVIRITSLSHIVSPYYVRSPNIHSSRVLWPVRVKLRVSPGQYPFSRALLPRVQLVIS